MDTKWKSRMIALFAAVLFTFGLNGLIVGMNFGSMYSDSSYFQSWEFENEVVEFIDLLYMFEFNHLTKEELETKIAVTQEEINEHRYRYGDLSDQILSIREQYEPRIQQAIGNNDTEILALLTDERDTKIADITNNFISDDHVRAKILAEKERTLDNYFQELNEQRARFGRYTAAFQYYFKDTETGYYYTNVAEAERGLTKNEDVVFFRQYPSANIGYLMPRQHYIYTFDNDLFVTDIELKPRSFEGQLAISKSAPEASFLLNNYYDYKERRKTFIIYVVCSILALVASVFLIRRKKVLRTIPYEKFETHYQKIPVDLRFIMLFITAFSSFATVMDTGRYYMYGNSYLIVKGIINSLVITTPLIILTVIQVMLLLPYMKNWPSLKRDWEKSVSNRSYQLVMDVFRSWRFGIQVLFLLVTFFLFGAGLFVAAINRLVIPYLALSVIIAIPVILVLKRIAYLNQIFTNASELAKGNYEQDLPIKGRSALAQHANHINMLKHGVKLSQREQEKSERLKTELITNVSHDLRTPLTSIITYTELLKSPDLVAADREAYVEIIDRKSKRLKVLIDDLFEASKMASGNIELSKARVDLVQLLQQALAEHNETVNESNLQFRVSMPEKSVYANVDGQKVWRVFDNLIRNILNYTLENTRVYISLECKDDQVEINFKNISQYELGGNVDEMFERFKRGDASRNTDGSGLGLAIAKSIVDLHEGNLTIKVDGDLFTVTVSLRRIDL
ncbi:GHKL domain-containing protein [Anaerobacillus alkaliphilus]|uniref:histidine kinase n=1 Tax=Anaerobacillus alkaliphilus TaxID=1548597 RepID=A0A4Q0VS95_9BACI|nr:histidine kinase dimerization/phospho-acceptor domain-containing protein [Anaerobacillus alkaliphilus]RXJ00673.1 GHKL domain-containing protein [Anaerobacillus alkaliphilus]